MGCGQSAILCSPPSAWMVEEPGFCIKWKTFITTACTPAASKSDESTARTTPRVASGRKAGSAISPCARERESGIGLLLSNLPPAPSFVRRGSIQHSPSFVRRGSIQPSPSFVRRGSVEFSPLPQRGRGAGGEGFTGWGLPGDDEDILAFRLLPRNR